MFINPKSKTTVTPLTHYRKHTLEFGLFIKYKENTQGKIFLLLLLMNIGSDTNLTLYLIGLYCFFIRSVQAFISFTLSKKLFNITNK